MFIAEIDDIAKTARRVSLKFPNRNLAPSFSPDGKRLAYLSRRGNENYGQESRAVVIRELDTEVEQPVKMAHIERVHWRHDGQALYLSGSDGKGRGGIFEFDLITKRTQPKIAEIGGPPKGYEFYPLAKGFVYLDGKSFRGEKGQPANPFPANGEGITEWLPTPTALFGVRDDQLIRFSPEGQRQYKLPGNRQPGASISPDGKTIAITAGREAQEIWSVDLGTRD